MSYYRADFNAIMVAIVLIGGFQLAKLPKFGRYSLETFKVK